MADDFVLQLVLLLLDLVLHVLRLLGRELLGLDGLLFQLRQQLRFSQLVGVYYFFHGLNSPAMSLLSEPLPKSEGLEHVGVVNCSRGVIWVFLIHVVLLVLAVLDLLEREPREQPVLAVNDDPLEQRSGRDAVLHAPHDLELVVVDLAHVSYRCRGVVLVLTLILLDKSGHDVVELVVVLVIEVHLVLAPDGHDVEAHHRWKSLTPDFRILVKLH